MNTSNSQSMIPAAGQRPGEASITAGDQQSDRQGGGEGAGTHLGCSPPSVVRTPVQGMAGVLGDDDAPVTCKSETELVILQVAFIKGQRPPPGDQGVEGCRRGISAMLRRTGQPGRREAMLDVADQIIIDRRSGRRDLGPLSGLLSDKGVA